jgi:hypothetical protein
MIEIAELALDPCLLSTLGTPMLSVSARDFRLCCDARMDNRGCDIFNEYNLDLLTLFVTSLGLRA